MKIGEFFLNLFSAEGGVSSKRFFGGMLVSFYIAGGIVSVVSGDISVVVESVLKTGLFAGIGLLGANVPENIVNIVKRPTPKVEVKEDEVKD